MMISNHFLCKDLVHHPIEPTIYIWLSKVPGLATQKSCAYSVQATCMWGRYHEYVEHTYRKESRDHRATQRGRKVSANKRSTSVKKASQLY